MKKLKIVFAFAAGICLLLPELEAQEGGSLQKFLSLFPDTTLPLQVHNDLPGKVKMDENTWMGNEITWTEIPFEYFGLLGFPDSTAHVHNYAASRFSLGDSSNCTGLLVYRFSQKGPVQEMYLITMDKHTGERRASMQLAWMRSEIVNGLMYTSLGRSEIGADLNLMIMEGHGPVTGMSKDYGYYRIRPDGMIEVR